MFTCLFSFAIILGLVSVFTRVRCTPDSSEWDLLACLLFTSDCVFPTSFTSQLYIVRMIVLSPSSMEHIPKQSVILATSEGTGLFQEQMPMDTFQSGIIIPDPITCGLWVGYLTRTEVVLPALYRWGNTIRGSHFPSVTEEESPSILTELLDFE